MEIKIINNKFEKKEFSIDKLIEMYNNKEFDVLFNTVDGIFFKIILEVKYEDKHKGIVLSIDDKVINNKVFLEKTIEEQLNKIKRGM